jgi:hypothetical protein
MPARSGCYTAQGRTWAPSILGSPMAEILPFTTRTPPSGGLHNPACPFSAPSQAPGAPAADPGDDRWPEDDAPGGVGLGLVARLAAAPARTLADLARKAEVLVARLAPDDDGADAGLCAAEVALLRSMLCDLQAVASDIGFALRGTGLLTAAATE